MPHLQNLLRSCLLKSRIGPMLEMVKYFGEEDINIVGPPLAAIEFFQFFHHNKQNFDDYLKFSNILRNQVNYPQNPNLDMLLNR